MASIRARLTVAYGGALVGTLVAFGIALSVARKANAYEELGREAGREANHVLELVRRFHLGPEGPAVNLVPRGDRNDAVALARGMTQELERHGGFFILLDHEDRIIYRSFALRHRSAESQAALHDAALRLRAGAQAAIMNLADADDAEGSESRILFVARRNTITAPEISRVIAGVPTSTAELAPALLIGTLLLVTPLILLGSLAVAYYLAGRAFQPVEQLINEVEAITDGRSLHRRLPTDPSNDELSRLTATLNAMIARLEHSFAALRRFTADASHELKTPLTVLRADVERVMNPGASERERMVALEEAIQEIARMADLVESLLTLARADEGRFDLARESIRVDTLVHDVFETATILGEDTGLTVVLTACDAAIVQGEPVRLRQLFLNLVTNAIKYTPRGGRVEIGLVLREQSGDAAFSVRDTGIGIAAADLPHIFDRFWRADRVRSRLAERGGQGLGLAISQWIAQAHGGTLTVQSRLGRGSIFTVTLPATGDPSRTAGTPATDSALIDS
jgi:two-component system, OmpR family, sensor kinase